MNAFSCGDELGADLVRRDVPLHVFGLQHGVVAGTASLGGEAGDHVGLLFQRSAVVGHESDTSAAQLTDLLHAGPRQQFGEGIGHDAGSLRCTVNAVTTAATITITPPHTTAV